MLVVLVGPYEVPGINPRFAAFRSSALPIILSPQLLIFHLLILQSKSHPRRKSFLNTIHQHWLHRIRIVWWDAQEGWYQASRGPAQQLGGCWLPAKVHLCTQVRPHQGHGQPSRLLHLKLQACLSPLWTPLRPPWQWESLAVTRERSTLRLKKRTMQHKNSTMSYGWSNSAGPISINFLYNLWNFSE